MSVDPPPEPPWPDQGGNVVVLDGGASEPRTKQGGAPPPTFPAFTVDTPANIQLGGWSGPPPGPPAGTGLVGPETEPGENGNGDEETEVTPAAEPAARAPRRRRKS